MNYKKYSSNIIAWLIIAVLLSAYVFIDFKIKSNLDYDYNKTRGYLETVSWAKYQTKAKQWQTPEKILEGTKYGQYPKDGVDYASISQIEEELDGVSRQAVLRKLFLEVNPHFKVEKNEVKWRNILSALDQSVYHHLFQQPVYEDGIIVADPLVLLELGNGRCGHISRIIVDIALANGYQARLVQAAHHVTAEVKWDKKWHLVDLPFIFNFSDKWPSLEELSLHSNEIDYFPPFYVYYFFNQKTREIFQENLDQKWNLIYNSSTYFGSDGLGALNNQISYWYKITGEWQSDKYYGWQQLTTEYVEVPKSPEYNMPNPEQLQITFDNQKVKILAPETFDPDNDFWRYELYLSDTSRGWSYQNKDNYRKFFEPIPSNIGIYPLEDELELNLAPGRYYLTYLAKDNYAKENPRAFYIPSEELSFEIPNYE